MGDLVKWTLLDERLIKCAANGLSPEQMEAELDIPAAQAAVRVRELLRSRDVWSTLERKQLLLESLYDLKSKAERALDPDNPKSIEANMKILDTLGKRLDAASEVNEADLDRVTTAQARKLLALFMAATERAKEILSETYPEAIVDEMEAALQEGLREAAYQIEAN